MERLTAESPPFQTDDNGLLVRTANPSAQIVVPHSLKQRLLALSHYPVLAGHTGGRKLYYRVKKRLVSRISCGLLRYGSKLPGMRSEQPQNPQERRRPEAVSG